MNKSRRTFIRTSLTGAALTISIPDLVSAAIGNLPSASKIKIARNDVVLFQGDSITDAGRNRDEPAANNNRALGTGYTFLAAAQLLRKHSGAQISVFNRGISGNKIYQLAERWEADCIALKPDILSILIGVNDYWHTLNGGYDGTVDVYRDDYKKLLDHTLTALPDVKLIIGEPFAINGVKAVTDDWFPAFDSYRQAAQDIATEYDAVFIPYQRVFDKAAREVSADYWTTDGVHTTLAGAQLMAETWLKTIG